MRIALLTSVSIKNFRSFEALRLDNLRRVNVVVGRNASGKTALLEAIRLASGATPTVAWNLNQSRGQPIFINPNPSQEQFEAPWRSMFSNFDLHHGIETEFVDDQGHKGTLRAFFDPERAITPNVTNPQHVQQWGVPSSITPLVFERMDFDGKYSALMATIQVPGAQFAQMHLEQGPELGPGMELFPSSWQFNSQQASQWFSQLAIDNRESEIVDAIRDEFSFISNLSVQSPNQVPAVYATLSYLAQKIPLAFVSSGINKLFVLITAILTFRGGAILVDEVENGLHASVLPDLWKVVHRLSSQSNTQLFLTTHSWECLRAARPIIEENPNDFSLIRLMREGQHSVPHQFSGSDLLAALEEEFDFRY